MDWVGRYIVYSLRSRVVNGYTHAHIVQKWRLYLVCEGIVVEIVVSIVVLSNAPYAKSIVSFNVVVMIPPLVSTSSVLKICPIGLKSPRARNSQSDKHKNHTLLFRLSKMTDKKHFMYRACLAYVYKVERLAETILVSLISW